MQLEPLHEHAVPLEETQDELNSSVAGVSS